MEITLRELLIFTRSKALLLSFLSHVFESVDTQTESELEGVFCIGDLRLHLQELAPSDSVHLSFLQDLNNHFFTLELSSRELLEEIVNRATFFYYRNSSANFQDRADLSFAIREEESVFLSRIIDPDGRVWVLQTKKLM